MAKLTAWKDDPKTFSVNTGVATVPKFYLSTAPIDTPALVAVKARETADGWPAEVTARSHARRQTKVRAWIGPNGVSLGAHPAASIVDPDILKLWVGAFTKPRSPHLFFDTRVDENEQYEPLQNKFIYTALGTTIGPALADYLGFPDLVYIDDELVEGAHMFYNVPSAACEEIRTRTEDETYFVIAIQYGFYNPDVFAVRYFRYAKPAHLAGFHGFFTMEAFNLGVSNYWHLSDNTWTEDQRIGRHLVVKAVAADDGWSKWMIEANAAIVPHYTDLTMGYRLNAGEIEYDVFFDVESTNPTTDADYPSASLFGAGVRQMGIWSADCYHIGDPEFADEVHFIGPTTWNPATKALTVATESLYLRWSGERLIDMSPNMVEEDREGLRGKAFVTRVVENVDFPAPLTKDLAMHDDLKAAGEEMETAIFMPARDDLPAVTFQQAENRAGAADRKLFHQVLGITGTLLDKVTMVKITGSSIAIPSTLVATSYAQGVVVSTNTDDAMFFVAEGVILVNEGVSMNSAVTDLFGMTQSELLSNKYRTAYKRHFDEVAVFEGGLPRLEKLSLPKRTAQQMVQYCQNRAQLSSFVVGGLTMGSVARRVLT